MRGKTVGHSRRVVAVLMLLAFIFGPAGSAGAQIVVDPTSVRAAAQASGLEPLGNVPVPVPNLAAAGVLNSANPNADRDLLRLGKAFFWDQQIGSDGQACASCHFDAGADNRAKNQLNPDMRRAIAVPPRDAGDVVNTPDSDTVFGNTGDFDTAAFPRFSGIGDFTPRFGPNYELVETDFPFHVLADPEENVFATRVVVRDTSDVASSQGAFNADFSKIKPGSPGDIGVPMPDAVFHVGGVNTRRVEPRNTPTNINAVFNFANFWDGRAHNTFNGESVVGPLDSNARILLNNGGVLVEQTFAIENSSLASQAVGPPLSRDEMSFNRRFQTAVGKKVVYRRPLAFQLVHPQDSVLGPLASTKVTTAGKVTGTQGLNTTYAALIRAAFNPKYWNSTTTFTFNPDGTRNMGGTSPNPYEVYTQMEGNFAFFFGLAVQRYQQGLVSDDTPFDRFMAGNDAALSLGQLQGLLVFLNQGVDQFGVSRNEPAVDSAIAQFQAANSTTGPGGTPIVIGAGNCISCHGGAEFTDASVRSVADEPIEIEDTPIVDPGILALEAVPVQGLLDNGFSNIGVRPSREDLGRGGEEGTGPFPLSFTRQGLFGLFGVELPCTLCPNKLQVDGAFKIPGLRNVELTGPYFHNGGQATLAQVIEFYDRQSDFGDVNIANLDRNLVFIDLDDADEEPLVAFLLALTDDRVRNKKAPFDHPQLFVPNGHPGDQSAITCVDATVLEKYGVAQACTDLREIRAVGAGGLPAVGLPPLGTFLGLDPFGGP
jgi:cytochrome c peroxidase